MTTSEWLDARVPPPPPNLRARLDELLREHVDGVITAEALVWASGKVLAHLVRDQETARASALELLAADALATYAFEVQADHPAALDAACSRAMQYLSGIPAQA